MNRFVFICPSYNVAETARQTILSFAAQSYQNWHVIFIDDVSTDDTENTVKGTFLSLGLGGKLTYIKNNEKLWEVANVLQGLKLCDDDDIVARCDMDDYLLHNGALEIFDNVYRSDPEIDFVWSMQWWFDKNGLTTFNISKDLPAGSDPYKFEWTTSHFRTHRKRLLTNVNDENYRGSDGNYLRRVGDQAFALPALRNARKWKFVPISLHAYRCDMSSATFQTEDAKLQKAEAEFLRARGFVE